ncbi:addiction module antidote protein [Janthinobacterium agaricidamnosum]|uniref:Putative transcriptional regulator n=1 Tax=Janthinobacterium agaricidamnosum NBRC 102515 = DSM 9628 TaxID=1349767 RepID=W0V9W3_9BURK|nr:addiction module antidote protein [Janthinobacterium agaricidamnosum]CDG84390.1 putative transcriptional regulator [Janthinobacterium agaricidamnosum NBRC 102515 = DSM 9628]
MAQDNIDTAFALADLKALGLTEFDPADYLTSPKAIAHYMSEIAATGNADLLQSAMNDVVRAHGMSKVAKEAQITREGAYKALRKGSKPRLETVMALLNAMGMQFAIVPKAHGSKALAA